VLFVVTQTIVGKWDMKTARRQALQGLLPHRPPAARLVHLIILMRLYQPPNGSHHTPFSFVSMLWRGESWATATNILVKVFRIAGRI
jgi:hypothetical protein